MSILGRPWGWKHWTLAIGAMLIACTLTALLAVTVIQTIRAKDDALDRLTGTAHQVRVLNGQIRRLERVQARDLRASARQRARLRTKINALIVEVEQLGGVPVVTIPGAPSPSPGPSPSRSASPTPSPSPRPSPSPTRSPTPSPSPTCGVPRPVGPFICTFGGHGGR